MTNDELALRKAVCLDPNDDLPRLVYADWLEERDLAANSIAFRHQIEHPDYLHTVKSWNNNLDHFMTFRRGFVEAVECDFQDYWENYRSWFTLQPITRIVFRDCCPAPDWMNYNQGVSPWGFYLPQNRDLSQGRYGGLIRDIFRYLPPSDRGLARRGWRFYATRTRTRTHLSFAAVNFARQKVGLPRLVPKWLKKRRTDWILLGFSLAPEKSRTTG